MNQVIMAGAEDCNVREEIKSRLLTGMSGSRM